MTGCAGLIGSHFSRHLLESGWDVVGVDDLSGGYRSSLPRHHRFRFQRQDLTKFAEFKRFGLACKPDVIYHFAAFAAEGLSPFIRIYNYQRNLIATSAVINLALELNSKVVFTSSMAVYGAQKPPFSEDMLPAPIDPYGIAKFAGELDLQAASVQHGLKFSIVRPHNVIGTHQNIWDRYRNVAGIFIRRGLSGDPLLVFGDGEQSRAFSDVKFFMAPLLKLAATGDGEIYNLGSDSPVKIIRLAQIVQSQLRILGYQTSIRFVEGRHEVSDAYCSHEKAKKLLSFEDSTDLEKIIFEMARWAVDQPSRKVRRVKYELTKGIYSYWKD